MLLREEMDANLTFQRKCTIFNQTQKPKEESFVGLLFGEDTLYRPRAGGGFLFLCW
jgi:hypothetical protein